MNGTITYEVERREAKFKSHWYPICARAQMLASLCGNGGTTITDRTIQDLASIGIMPVDVTPSGLDALLDANNHEE